MKLNPIPLLILSLWAGPMGRAAEFTLDAAVACALTNNADLAAARLRIDEARSRAGNAGRWANPELETELKPGVRGREGTFSLGFSQRFPLTSRLRLEKALSRSEVAVAEAEVRDAERLLVLETRTAAIRLAALQAKDALLEAQLRNSRELAATHARAADAGEGSALDAAQIELEIAQLETQRAQLRSETEERRGALAHLLGFAPSAELAVAEVLALPEVASASSGPASNRTDLVVGQMRADSARQAVEIARSHRWEDATLGLFGEIDRSEDAPNGVETMGFIGLRFSVPLPLWNDRSGLVAEAAARAARIEREAEALSLRIRAEIAAAEQQRNAALILVRSIQDKLLPQARALEKRFESLHAQGQVPFTETLRARERRLHLEAAELDARRDYHLARARWMAATGQTLSVKP